MPGPNLKFTCRISHYRYRDGGRDGRLLRIHAMLPTTGTQVMTTAGANHGEPEQFLFRNHAGNRYESGEVLERLMPLDVEDQLWKKFWVDNPNCLIIYNKYDEAAIRPTDLRDKTQKGILLPITPLYHQGKLSF